MRYASVALDIPTRQLDGTFSYAVPDELADASVTTGATVLVSFSHRLAVGYVMTVSAEPPEGEDPAGVLPVEQLLTPGAFDGAVARGAGGRAGGRFLRRMR